MASYLVTWRIDIDADSPTEAAAQALIIQRDPESTAVVFDVTERDDNGNVRGGTVSVDLMYPDNNNESKEA